MKLRAKTDKNQRAIVNMLRKMGCSVFVTSSMGHGFPDLVVGLEGKNYLLEVKTPMGKAGRPAPKTPAQETFCDGWRGQYQIVSSPLESWWFVKKIRRQEYADAPVHCL